MASRRVRQMIHPIAAMRLGHPWKNRHRNVQRDNPFWEQKLSSGKFMLRDPLRDSPDWTYSDGRPTPYNEAQLKVKQHQVNLASEIVKNLKELKDAETEHQDFAKQEQEAIRAALQATPRAKGSNHPRAKTGTR